MTNKFEFLYLYPNMSKLKNSFNEAETKENKLLKNLREWAGFFYYEKIIRQVDNYLKLNKDYEDPYRKANRIFLAYLKLAEKELNFFESFYIISFLLQNLDNLYKQEQFGNMTIDYHIDNFISSECYQIIQIKKREGEQIRKW